MGNDISKQTVLVLLVLTLVISIFGTWFVLSQPKTIYETTDYKEPQTRIVGVGIADLSNAPVTDEGGRVSISILK